MSKSKSSTHKRKMINLSNKSTIMPSIVQKEIIKWIPETSIDKKTQKMLKDAKSFISQHCYITLKDWQITFNSSQHEGNCYIIRSIVESFIQLVKVKPHIITSALEDSSILETCKRLRDLGQLEVTIIDPNKNGIIDPVIVQTFIKRNTCLISISHINNVVGSINNIRTIGDIATKNDIPFHVDATDTFGKIRLNLEKYNIDMLTASADKFNGPIGIGLLIIRKQVIDGYQLKPQIFGPYFPNISLVVGAVIALKWSFHNRSNKDQKIEQIKNLIIKELNLDLPSKNLNHQMMLTPSEQKTIPHILTISFPQQKNIKTKQFLKKNNIYVSIPNENILKLMEFPSSIIDSSIQINISETTTITEVKQFIKSLSSLVS